MEIKQRKAMSVVMLPHLAHGHVSPFFELAKRLSDRGFQIYFCSTPICLEPIRNNHLDDHHNKHSSSNIQLIDLQLPSSFHQDLPPHYHCTKNIPPHLMTTLLAALDATKPAFSDILKKLRPDLVVYDLFEPWAAEAARELNIDAVLFLTNIASQNVRIETPKETEMSKEYIEYTIKNTVNGITPTQRFNRSVTGSSHMILVKTSREIQAKYYKDGKQPHLAILRPLVHVGPLVQKPQDHHDGDEKLMDWLSKKEAASVVYVSIGSENFLSEEEMEEMAKGLELSNVDFIWVVRFHGGSNVASIHEALPQSFLERINGRGLIVDWAPQAKVLAHASTGGFVSHCGWNSTLESMMYGVPIIAIPIQLDQPLNAKLVVEMGVGVEVPRHDKKLVREEVANMVRRVMIEEEGNEVRKRAKELSVRLNEAEDEEFDEAVMKLVHLVQEPRNISAVASKETRKLHEMYHNKS
uniref:Glycosyltransferase n=1 Tax=Litchi chinensis TaxID=151069 RepID=W8FVK4_LITCN|nr:flavanone-O-beta-L-rhamnosyltransferase-like protein 2 [Litchi chinensis]